MRQVLISLATITLLFVAAPGTIQALSGSDWRAGNIIDDAIFYNSNGMSTQDIQNFLNSKVPTCDTNGTKPSEYGGGTRAQYGTSKGHPPPYTCLKSYSQGGKSAAQIIKDAAIAYNINPKALIVLLQKEQSLVTDDWPWNSQYRSATGYGCPDTAPCDAEYFGFTNQVTKAAYQFRRYATYPSEYRYKPYQSNYIQYNPNSSCGGTNVHIENLATAGLYNYTPYQPNASALNNLYGSGNSCGAYGNRNFWRLFTDWFGSTRSNRWSNMSERRVMVIDTSSLGGSPTYKINPDTNAVYYDNPLVEGQEIYFYSKTTLSDGSLCLRTKVDTGNNVNKCVKIARLQEFTPVYQSLSESEKNSIAIQFTYKVDYIHDDIKTDYGIQPGQPITLSRKVVAVGQTYYITQKDYTENNAWRGIKAERVKPLSNLFSSFELPRYMYANKQTNIVNLSTGTTAGSVEPYKHFYFNKKVTLGDKEYYTSDYLRDQNQYYAILSTDISNGIRYQPFVSPRSMELSTSTYKFSLDSNTNVDDLLLAGRVVHFSQKIKINNKEYYRTTVDAGSSFNKVIDSTKVLNP